MNDQIEHAVAHFAQLIERLAAIDMARFIAVYAQMVKQLLPLLGRRKAAKDIDRSVRARALKRIAEQLLHPHNGRQAASSVDRIHARIHDQRLGILFTQRIQVNRAIRADEIRDAAGDDEQRLRPAPPHDLFRRAHDFLLHAAAHNVGVRHRDRAEAAHHALRRRGNHDDARAALRRGEQRVTLGHQPDDVRQIPAALRRREISNRICAHALSSGSNI